MIEGFLTAELKSSVTLVYELNPRRIIQGATRPDTVGIPIIDLDL